MATLKETAQAYTPKQTKNIADLPYFSANIEVKKDRKKTKEGEEFDLCYIEVEGEKYRVPDSVLKGMKAIFEKIPNIENFTVLKTGTGMQTEYQVIPYQLKV